MSKKRFLSAILLILALCSVASAQQRLDILLKNKSIISCPIDDIDYMEIVEPSPP